MDSSLQLRVLEVLEGAENYNRWIAALTLPFLGDDPVEVGSGIGVSAALWLGSGLPRITVTDTDETSLERLRAGRFCWWSPRNVFDVQLSASICPNRAPRATARWWR